MKGNVDFWHGINKNMNENIKLQPTHLYLMLFQDLKINNFLDNFSNH